MSKLWGIFIFATFLSTGSCLRCYVCNSFNDTDCSDIAPHSKSRFLSDCDTHTERPPSGKYTLCRKIEMYFDMNFGEAHPKSSRIHRACGYIEDEEERDCYYKSGYHTRSWICSCRSDDCNTSSLLTPSAMSIVLLVGVSTLAWLQRERLV